MRFSFVYGDQLLIIEFKEVPSISRSVYFTVPYVISASHVIPVPPVETRLIASLHFVCMVIKCVFHLCMAYHMRRLDYDDGG